jgi:hypothetical protein
MKLTEISIEELKRAYLATLKTSGSEAPATRILWRELDRRILQQAQIGEHHVEAPGKECAEVSRP